MITTTRRRNPFTDLQTLQREMNRLFDRHPVAESSRRVNYPPVNIWRGPEGVAFTVMLPGYEPDEVEVTTTRNALTLRGHRRQPEKTDGQVWVIDERHQDEFLRTFELPFEVDPSKTDATFDKGVLLVSLGQPEEEKPRKVQIKAAN